MATIHGLAFTALGLVSCIAIVLGGLVVSCRRALADADRLLDRDAEELDLLADDLHRSYQAAEDLGARAEAAEAALDRSHQYAHDLRIKADAAEAEARFFETVLARKNGEADALKAELAKARRAATLASADADGATKDAGAMFDLIAAIHDSTGDMLDTYSTTCGCCGGCCGDSIDVEPDDDQDDGTFPIGFFSPSPN